MQYHNISNKNIKYCLIKNFHLFSTSDQHNYLNTTSFLRNFKKKKIIVDDNLKEILTFKVVKTKFTKAQ